MKKKNVIILSLILILSLTLTLQLITAKHTPTIKIGVISSTTAGFTTQVPLYDEIIEPDINEYCSRLPFLAQCKFEFIHEDAEGNADTHLEKVQMFHEMGVDLIIGAG